MTQSTTEFFGEVLRIVLHGTRFLIVPKNVSCQASQAESMSVAFAPLPSPPLPELYLPRAVQPDCMARLFFLACQYGRVRLDVLQLNI